MKPIILFLSFFLSFGVIVQAQPKKEAQNPYAALGQKSVLEGDFKTAVTHLEKAAKASPEDSDVMFMLGYSYYHSGAYSNAITSFSKVVSLRPETTKAYYYRAKARNILGAQMSSSLSPVEREKLLQASIRDFSKCIELKTDENIEYYQNRAIAYRDYAILKEQKTGGIYDRPVAESSYKSSIADFQHILDINPGRTDIANEMKKSKVYLANLK